MSNLRASTSHQPFWVSLQIGITMVNFDGAWPKENFHLGLGVIFCSYTGSIVAGATKQCLSSSVLQAEAKAALLAVATAIDNGILNVAYESDS